MNKEEALAALSAIFKELVCIRNKADYVCILKYNKNPSIKPTVYFQYGEANSSNNIFSCTKSIFGLYLLIDYLINNIPIEKPLYDAIKGIVPAVNETVLLLSQKPIIDYLNHVSGIVTGATEPNKDRLGEWWNTRFAGDLVDSYKTLKRGLWMEDTVKNWNAVPEGESHEFSYNNYGIQIAGILYELLKRMMEGIDVNDHRIKFNLRDECTRLFFAPVINRRIEWPVKNEDDVYEHSCTFSGIEISGKETMDVLKHLWDHFRPALAFIKGHPYISPTGAVVENNFRVYAPDKNVDIGFETQHEYYYSFGWWIPQIDDDCDYVAMHGMYGNRMIINTKNGFAAIRKMNYGVSDQVIELAKAVVTNTSMNSDPSFDWHVRAYELAIEAIENGDQNNYETVIENFKLSLNGRFLEARN